MNATELEALVSNLKPNERLAIVLQNQKLPTLVHFGNKNQVQGEWVMHTAALAAQLYAAQVEIEFFDGAYLCTATMGQLNGMLMLCGWPPRYFARNDPDFAL